MKTFAILRAAKLKTRAKLRSTGRHNLERGTVPNANPNLADRNRYLHIGGDKITWQKTSRGLPELEQQVADRVASIEARGGKIQANAVKALELLFTASPEMIKSPNFDLNRWVRQTMKWVAKEFGRQNILQGALHMDESTPHMHVIVIPEVMMRETRGRKPKDPAKAAAKAAGSPEKPALAAHLWVDGGERMSAMQDRYAAAVADLGLTRGIKRTRLNHAKVSAFYGAAEQIEERGEQLQQRVSAAVAALPEPALINKPAAVRDQRSRQEELAKAATEAVELARDSERAALLFRLQLETAQAQLDALGGAEAAQQIIELREKLQAQQEQQRDELAKLEQAAAVERENLQQAIEELRGGAARDRESLRAAMQADIDHWKQHAGELQGKVAALESKEQELRVWGRDWRDHALALEKDLHGPAPENSGPTLG